jgi:DNA-binding transcriptional MerR regulator
MAATIDTLRITKRFRDAGVPEAQAEVFAETFREREEAGLGQLATKAELEAGLAALRAELRAELAALEQRISAKITESQNSLIKWLVPLLLGQTALIVALVKLLPG